MAIYETYHVQEPVRRSAPSERLPAKIAAKLLATFDALRTRYRAHRRRKLDRAAFLTLLGKDEWVYRDLGISRGDVEWLARQPLEVNAARELQKIRTEKRHQW